MDFVDIVAAVVLSCALLRGKELLRFFRRPVAPPLDEPELDTPIPPRPRADRAPARSATFQRKRPRWTNSQDSSQASRGRWLFLGDSSNGQGNRRN